MAGTNIVIGGFGSGSGGSGQVINGWTRPSEWPDLNPLMEDGQNKILGLVAVYPNLQDPQLVWFGLGTSAGATMHIDWGDGTDESRTANNYNFMHEYDYNSSGLINTSLGYKIAIVTMTSSSNAITNFALNVTPTAPGSYFFQAINSRNQEAWLEFDIRSPNLTLTQRVIDANSVEHIRIRAFQSGSASTAFNNLQQLKAVSFVETAETTPITNTSSMFQSCPALVEAPMMNTSSATVMSSMFSGCNSLTKVPLYNTSSCTNFNSMFHSCRNLKSIPLLNTAQGTNFNSMFNQCRTLQEVPNFNLSSATNVSSMFQQCFSLRRCRISTFPNNSTILNVFAQCTALGANALNEIYTNLPVTTTQTLTVNQCLGKNLADDTLATDKGWTLAKT